MIDDFLGGNWRRQHHKVSEELRHFPGMTLLDANFLLIFLELFVYFRLKGTQCSSLLELWQRLGVARCWDCSFKSNMAKGTARQPQEPKAAKIAMSFLGCSPELV